MVNSAKSKELRRQQALAKARKSHKQRDWFTIGTIIGVVVLILGIGTFITVQNLQVAEQSNVAASETTPPNTINDGFSITKDGLKEATPYPIETTFNNTPYDSEEVNISMYVDYACPHCGEFEAQNAGQMDAWLQSGQVDTVTVHPMAFLSPYSADAANAVSCVAEFSPEHFFEAHNTLLADQISTPKATAIVNRLEELGVPASDDFTKCVVGGKYDKFISEATLRAQAGPLPAVHDYTTGVQGTPTIFVNGYHYPGNPDPEAFAGFVGHIANGGTLADLQEEAAQQEGEESEISTGTDN